VENGRRARSHGRVLSDGKFLSLDGAPFRVRAVTYGTFAPRADSEPYPEPARVEADFRAIAAAGLNTVRTYTAPPCDVLDAAEAAGLRVLVGLWYDDWRSEPQPGRAAHQRVREAGRRALADALDRCGGRESVLAISVGNEIPADVIRVHGIRGVEDVLARLVAELHEADDDLLATYTNFPTSEFLDVAGQDLVCFNVFLERPDQFRPYLHRLQTLAGERPLLITELGLAAAVHGERAQAESLDWQLRAVDEAGCAGAAVFAWTDEWHVGGHAVDGWGFGLTDAERRPRPALETVARWARSSVRDLRAAWPRVSVVVCAHNAEDTLEPCLRSLIALDYSDAEVIVCDDGSTDATAAIARRFGVRVLELPHRGLSAARNEGIAAAGGDIVAFIDADARAHPEWLYHLVLSLEDGVAGTGGPNLPEPRAELVERAVSASPGAPVHVLLGDDRAEHVPGCNMAFRKQALEQVGGFDPVYTTAGDDVDVCWKLLDRGGRIAFAAAAQVRHRRRDTVRGYLRQQRSYGAAERVLAERHRHRFNRLGQARWGGVIYGGPRLFRSLLRPVIYHGPMGSAPFQPVVRSRADEAVGLLSPYVPLAVPTALLGALAPLSAWWLTAPALALAAVAIFAAAVALAVRPARGEPQRLRFRLLAGFLHVAQPLARTGGRARAPAARPAPEAPPRWTGDRQGWLFLLARELRARRCTVRAGNEHDDWDLAAAVGPLLSCRVTTAVAWHWVPMQRLALRPRAGLAVAIAAAVAATAADARLGLAFVTLLATAFAVEALALLRATRGALVATTRVAEATAAQARQAEPDRPLAPPVGYSRRVYEGAHD
jgi:glycosyltransferase involved in cell wall biosynthesis